MIFVSRFFVNIKSYILYIYIVHGKNNFGQDGSYICSSSNPDDGCKGNLICQLDPYGCSCAAGYQGRDCQTGI